MAIRDRLSNPDAQRQRAWDRLLEITADKGGDVFAEDVEDHNLCTRPEAIAHLRLWQTHQWGTVIVGRRGGSTRFRPRDLVRRAIRERKGGLAAAAPAPDADRAATAPATAALVNHIFLLRPDLTITLQLPCDMNDREATRLARFVEALPI